MQTLMSNQVVQAMLPTALCTTLFQDLTGYPADILRAINEPYSTRSTLMFSSYALLSFTKVYLTERERETR